MTLETEAYRRVLSVLHEYGIEYMIVGSYAATQHGHIRTTHDLDVVIALDAGDVTELASALGDEFFLDAESACEAVRRSDMFNAIHMPSGVKIDFWILKDDEFSRTQFVRRECIDFEGVPACFESAEDTILSKLRWYTISPSDRQLNDVRGILQVQQGRLDWDYLRNWAERLGIVDLLRQVSEE